MTYKTKHSICTKKKKKSTDRGVHITYNVDDVASGSGWLVLLVADDVNLYFKLKIIELKWMPGN